MPEYTNQQILGAINELLPMLPDLLDKKAAEDLSRELSNLLSQVVTAENKMEIVTRALLVIRIYDPARYELKKILIKERPEDFNSRLGIFFEDTPGGNLPIQPGEKVVCPIDPTHLKKRLRVQGERCPQHNVELVPEDLYLKKSENS